MKPKRIFLIVLDSVGAGALPDAADFGDAGTSTIRTISAHPAFSAETMCSLGYGNIEGLSYLGKTAQPLAAYGRAAELSRGKDSTVGHWEIAGLVSDHPLPTYPDGFPEEIIKAFEAAVGRRVLCNKPYSGTEVIKDYGEEHLKTGALIVYTSADSVFQIAAHEDIVPVETLYDYCRKARELLVGANGVGRVIARPFAGEPGSFYRTANRHDFSLVPFGETMLDALHGAGLDTVSVGKISDLFAGRGVSESHPTHSNDEGMEITASLLDADFTGLCFVNLVDFDSQYGHRNDVPGYAAAFAAFDRWLGGFLPRLHDDDLLIITADHGCDPGDVSTDHTREYIPLLVYGSGVSPVSLGTRRTFADIAATVTALFDVPFACPGRSFLDELYPMGFEDEDAQDADITPVSVTKDDLIALARRAMTMAYAPYSGCTVGAALLAASGNIYLGCNIENAAFTPTNCAERTAFFKAVSEGEREFSAIAVVGAKNGVEDGPFPPCGVCRQVMREFCDPKTFLILLADGDSVREYTLGELLPESFGPQFL